MASISSAMNLVSQAIDANQAALNIVSNNVANANTDGYTEETAQWQENSSVTISGISYGQGATVTGAVSQRDLVLNERLNQQQQLYSASSTRLTALDSVQSLFTPATSTSSTSGDIGTDLSSFFSSFSSLEASPTSSALRESVLSSATTLASAISSTASSLETQQSTLNQDASGVVTQINTLTTAIAGLNQQIASVSPTGDAGTLEDQRQLDLTNLSKLVGFSQVSTAHNGIELTTTSGQVLVSGSQSTALTTGTSAGVTHIYLGGTDVTTDLTSGGGELGGYLTARDVDVAGALSQLDTLAYNVSTQVNTLNNSGQDLNGTTSNSGDIFYQPTAVSGSAATMAVVMTDPSNIAAASSTAGTGDNTNAVAMADLANQTIVSGYTPSNYYSNFVSTLGSTVTSVQTANTAQDASLTQLQTQIDSYSGVNLNDEASSLTTMERSYQAASQVYSILNTLMASAINLGTETTVSA